MFFNTNTQHFLVASPGVVVIYLTKNTPKRFDVIQVFFQSMFVAYSGAVMPGSLLAYTIDRSLRQGAKTGLLVSTGHAILELFVVSFLLLGASRFLNTTAAQTITAILGGIILLYLGAGMIRNALSKDLSVNFPGSKGKRTGNLLLGGALLSVSNPYFTIWWVAIGLGLVTSAYTLYGLTGVIVFYLGHIMADITWYVFVSIIISKTRNFISLKIYRAIILILGIFIIAFGTRFLVFAAGNLT